MFAMVYYWYFGLEKSAREPNFGATVCQVDVSECIFLFVVA